MTETRTYWFVMGWMNGMELPAYVDGPFLSRGDAKASAIDWMFSGKADVYSVMSTTPQVNFTYRDAVIAAERREFRA